MSDEDGPNSATETKLMTISFDEFYRSLTRLAPNVEPGEESGEFDLNGSGFPVRIIFKDLGTETMGGLLALPRAQISLIFDHNDGGQAFDKQDFLHRFDIAFQRGGG